MNSSKRMQSLRAIMAKYDEPNPRRQVVKRPTRPAPAPVSAPRVKQPARPAQIARDVPPPAPRATGPHLPRELIWDTFEGIKVLVSEIPNYAATRSPSGEYSVIQLEPRTLIARRLRLKDVMPTIRRHHEKQIERQIQAADHQRELENKDRATLEAFENSPGFYIVPGETVGPDDAVYNATGPYWRFERIDRLSPPEDNSQITDEDVEADARETSRRLGLENNSTPVVIIEARNAREAAQGKGHVWWVEGALKGPPVDPRQTGFRW
jgi:hypothetical protein